MFEYRMLNSTDFEEVVRTLQLGFSDYIVKFELDSDGYRKKFAGDGVDLADSVGAFDNDKMVGVIVNASRKVNNNKELYNAGTVVVPGYRRKGLSTAMFDYGLPILKRRGFKRYLLEVITTNEPAASLYKKLGFVDIRRVGVYSETSTRHSSNNLVRLETKTVGVEMLRSERLFDDFGTTWQNSNNSMENLINAGVEVVLYAVGTEPHAVGALLPDFGRVLRLKVDKRFRREGIAGALLKTMRERSSKPLSFLNIDTSLSAANGFLDSQKFELKIEQFVMELDFEGV